MKKLTAMLFILVLVAGLLPERTVRAAELPKMSVSTRTIYVGGSTVQSGKYASGSYTLKVKNKVSKYSCSWSTDNKSVVSVTKKPGAKAVVTAIKPGTANVTANYVDKKTNTRYTLICKVTVCKNCAAVNIYGYDTAPVEIGSTMNLSAKMFDKSGAELEYGEDVTDIVKWMSSDESVATVNADGKVTAVGGGKADITCYTVQSSSGTYSSYTYATAKKTVTVQVEDPDIVGITNVKIKSVNTVEVALGTDFSETLSKDNFSITGIGGITERIASIGYGENKKTVFLTTENEFSDGTAYTVVLKNTSATVGLMSSFTLTRGLPASMEIVTPVVGNKVIAGTMTELKFRLYNAQGIDITPSREDSTDYINYKRCITFSEVKNGSWFVNDGSIFVYEENQSVGIKAVFDGSLYYNGSYTPVKFEKSGYVYSVSEASTLVFNGIADMTVTVGNTSSEKLTFDGRAINIPINDEGDLYIVARVKDANGKYIYSNDSSSGISFEPNTTNACFVDSTGRIVDKFRKGSDQIKVKYKNTLIGAVTVNIIESRTAKTVIFETDGKTADSLVASDSFGIGTADVTVKVIDQYNGLLPVRSTGTMNFASNLRIEPVTTGSYGPTGTAYSNSDYSGRVEFEAYGHGSTTGTAYRYKVIYDDTVYGKAEGYFTLVVKTPVSSAASTYQVRVLGNTDLTVNESTAEFPVLQIKLYELKGGLKYSLLSPVYTVNNVTDTGSYYYRLYLEKSGSSTEIRDAGCVQNDRINTVYVNSQNKLVKLDAGAYKLTVYCKMATGTDRPVANVAFVLTDKASGYTVEQKSTTTSQTVSSSTAADQSLLRAIFDECFVLRRGTETVPVTDISFDDREVTVDQNGIFFNSVTVVTNVTVNGRQSSIETRIEVRKYIRSR